MTIKGKEISKLKNQLHLVQLEQEKTNQKISLSKLEIEDNKILFSKIYKIIQLLGWKNDKLIDEYMALNTN